MGKIDIFKLSTWNGNELVNRNGVRVGGKICQCAKHLSPIKYFLSHPDNAATADFHAAISNNIERIKAVLERSCGDDFTVKFFGGINVVIIII